MRRIIKWGVITAAGILLFLWGKSYALHWRGYKAAGGEIAFLFLPLLWGIIQSNIKATREAVKADE